MRKQTAINLCKKCVGRIQYRGARATLQNPAVLFARDEKHGRFRGMPDDVVADMRAEAEEAAVLWGDKSRRTAESILMDILTDSAGKDLSRRRHVAEAFADLLTDPDDEETAQLSAGTSMDMEDYVCEQTEEILDDLEHRFDHVGEELLRESFGTLPPKKIRDNVAKKVVGQPEAVKAAAMIVYNHLAGRRTNAVFAGPSGCGKSEIWRTLTNEYPGLVRMVDFSRFSAEGWNGSLHLRDIFDGADAAAIKDLGLIVVLDEADKILCESAVGGGGTDHHVLLQNDLLKRERESRKHDGACNGQPRRLGTYPARATFLTKKKEKTEGEICEKASYYRGSVLCADAIGGGSRSGDPLWGDPLGPQENRAAVGPYQDVDRRGE